MSDQISTRTIAPYLALVLAACRGGADPVKHTVEKAPEVQTMDKTYEGVVRIGTDHVAIEHDGTRVELADAGNGVFGLVKDCQVRATTRDNKIVRLELKGANCAYTEVGPLTTMTGTLVNEKGPAGSKLSDSASDYFDADGVRYGVAGGTKPEPRKPVTARVRVLKANMAYVARSTESDVWFERD